MDAEKRYAEKQKREGFIKVCVWIPEPLREKLLAFAARLRRQK